MVQGTMNWSSRSKEFGLVTPDSGGRDIFVRFSPAIASNYSSDGQGGFAVTDEIAPTQPRHEVGSRVEVRTRYQEGQWAGGYEIAEVVELGYRVRCPGSRETHPAVFVPTDVRDAGD